MKRERIVLCFSFPFLIGLSGCAFFPPNAPTDLTLDTVRVAEIGDLPQSVRNEIDINQKRQPKATPKPKQVLEISFSTQRSADALADDYDLLGFTAIRCVEWADLKAYEKLVEEDGNTLRAGFGPKQFGVTNYLFYQGKPVIHDAESYGPYAPSGENRSSLHQYQIYLPVLSPIEDICFQVHGWAMTPFNAAPGNVVTIPHTVIEQAEAAAK